MTANAYLLMWCVDGLEFITPITHYEEAEDQKLFDMIATGKKPAKAGPLDQMIRGMILRAQFNVDRHYEIYAVDCSPDISEEDIKECFKDTPNEMAKTVREKGVKIHGSPAPASKYRIMG